MGAPLYISVDLGAGSGRVFLVSFEPERIRLEEVRRFRYPPRDVGGRLSWDFERIFENVSRGIGDGVGRARAMDRYVTSVGVDSWAVDYGLLDESGALMSDPVCYRDRRTLGVPEEVFAYISKSEIFSRTGIQVLDFNTLYQLCTERENLPRVDKLLLLPDLINNRLCGSKVAEYTNATATQMVNAVSGDWDTELLNSLDISAAILPEIVETGTSLGAALDGTLPVVAVASHDTASAVAAAPLSPSSAYISSGTWSLVGLELERPIINEQVSKANFTNEGGAFGTTRFLKNVMGLWILERCRDEWRAAGIETSYDDLIEGAFSIGSAALIYPDDQRFVNPASMLGAINEQLAETGHKVGDEPESLAKTIFDSLAFRYASVLRMANQLSGVQISQIEILGGGGRNRYLNQMTANASGVPVRAGLFEATVVGNALVQAIASRQFTGCADGRRHIERVTEFAEFAPKDIDPQLSYRYAEIEKTYLP